MDHEIIKHLYYDQALSIADLSRKLAKSTPSITKVVNHLVDQGIISEQGFAESTGGRRPIQYAIHPQSTYCMLTISCDQYYTSIVISNLSQQLLFEKRDIAISLDKQGSADTLLTELDLVWKDSGIQMNTVFGIGISMPGFVNAEMGINESFSKDNPLYAIRDTIEQKYHIPTTIENDSRCIALAEKELGLGKGVCNSLVVNLNWGVGLGIIINNQIFKGEAGFAGEFSHIPLSDNNTLCSCGKRGCLEVEASLNAAIRNTENDIENNEYSIYSTFIKSNPNKLEALIESANVGDQIAINNLGKIGYMLGKGLATLIHILNPSQIIISGRGAEIGRILQPQIQIALNEFCIPEIAKTTTVQMSTLNKNTQIKGTTALVVEKFINTILN